MYHAFISYSHAADGEMAPVLQSSLEKFAKPWYKERSLNIFRDEASLSASPYLWPNIQKALDASSYLIFLASPGSAASKWVAREIEYWLSTKSADTLLIALTEGEIVWDETTKQFARAEINSLPEILEKTFTAEPFYVDLRNISGEHLSLNNPVYKKEVLKLAAQLHGKEPKDLLSDELTAYKRMIRIRNSAIGSLVLLLVAAIVAGFIANQNRKLAQKNATEALNNSREAQRQKLIAQDSARVAQQQRQYAQQQTQLAIKEKNNAIKQTEIAQRETNNARIQKNTATANYLISEAQLMVKHDPTYAFELAWYATQKSNDPSIWDKANKIYHENNFYETFKDVTDLRLNIKTEYPRYVGATYSPDGQHILTTLQQSENETILRIRDLKGKFISEIKTIIAMGSAVFSPNGKLIALGTKKGINIWDLNGNLVKFIELYGGYMFGILQTRFSPDGTKIIACGSGGACVWDIDGNNKHCFSGHTNLVKGIAISADNKLVATCSRDMTARVCNLNDSLIVELKGHTGTVNQTDFSPDGKKLLTCSNDSTVRIWSIPDGKLIQQIDAGLNVGVAKFSNDGNKILAACWGGDYLIKLYKLDSGATAYSYKTQRWEDAGFALFTTFKGHKYNIETVEFSKDEKYILSSGLDATVKIWEIPTSKMIHEGNGHDISFVTYDKKERAYFGFNYIDEVYQYNLNGEGADMPLESYDGDASARSVVAFSPDKKRVLIASDDGVARLYETKKPLELFFKNFHFDPLTEEQKKRYGLLEP